MRKTRTVVATAMAATVETLIFGADTATAATPVPIAGLASTLAPAQGNGSDDGAAPSPSGTGALVSVLSQGLQGIPDLIGSAGAGDQ